MRQSHRVHELAVAFRCGKSVHIFMPQNVRALQTARLRNFKNVCAVDLLSLLEHAQLHVNLNTGNLLFFWCLVRFTNSSSSSILWSMRRIDQPRNGETQRPGALRGRGPGTLRPTAPATAAASSVWRSASHVQPRSRQPCSSSSLQR